MEFTDIIKNRYSCKRYSDRAVEADKLAAILEAGRVAPTAKNLQEQRVYVLQSTEALEKFDGLTPCRYGAPTVLLVAFDSENVYAYPGGRRDSGVEDANRGDPHDPCGGERGRGQLLGEPPRPRQGRKNLWPAGKRDGPLRDRPGIRRRRDGPTPQPLLAQGPERDRHAVVGQRSRWRLASRYARPEIVRVRQALGMKCVTFAALSCAWPRPTTHG